MSTPATSITPPDSPVTARIAGFASTLERDAIPEGASTVARQCLLDWLGVSLAGSRDRTVEILRAEALDQGGHAQASLVGGPGRAPVLQAALVNGTAGHALDYDDVIYAMPGHPTAPVAPAVLALAEREGSSGSEVITAFVAGVESECRIGRYVSADHYEQGWHATGTLGTFGAAAGAARLLGLDATATATALGIAGTQAAGLKSLFGTMCKPMHAGKAAHNGLHAALLAARGFGARDDVLECAQGFGATQSSGCDPHALAEAERAFFTRDILFKYHAACYGTHSTIEAARSLVARQEIRAGDIASVEIRIRPRYLKMCAIPSPRTGLEAKFSLAMTCAMALTGVSTAAPERYDEVLCKMEPLAALVARTTVTPSDEYEDATSEIIVSLENGVVYRVRGDVSRPAEDLAEQGRRLREKFDALAGPVLGASRAAEVADMVHDMEQLTDVRALMALTRT
jgi:2-methylcitrate dehydratase PrpD